MLFGSFPFSPLRACFGVRYSSFGFLLSLTVSVSRLTGQSQPSSSLSNVRATPERALDHLSPSIGNSDRRPSPTSCLHTRALPASFVPVAKNVHRSSLCNLLGRFRRPCTGSYHGKVSESMETSDQRIGLRHLAATQSATCRAVACAKAGRRFALAAHSKSAARLDCGGMRRATPLCGWRVIVQETPHIC